MLIVNALSHLLVDAVCAATLFGLKSGAELIPLLLLYNTLAFSSQCLVGQLTDRIGHWDKLSAAACAFLGVCALLPIPAMWKAACLGLGNSLFHVAAGSVTLADSGGRAAPLGLFVAPGAVGLMAGTLFPVLRPVFACLLFAAAALTLFAGRRRPEPPEPQPRSARWAVIVLLLAAVAARAIGGTAAYFPWKTTALASAALAIFVFAGKAAGGLICDRLGTRATALLSIPAAALLIAFCGGSMPLSLLGQLLLNLTMPITLWLIYRELPDFPGFAFGLPASVLWPAQLVGQSVAGAGEGRWLWILLSFALGLFAIYYAVKGEKTREKAD